MAKANSKFIKELAEILDAHNLTEIELEGEDGLIRVARDVTPAIVSTTPAPAPAMPSAAPPPTQSTEPPAAAPKPDTSADGHSVTSPMVGTIYIAPEPGAPPFINIGDTVSAGQTLFIIEAMKTMNPITAPDGGVVKQILVEDSQPVEFGEALVVIE